MAQQIRFFLPTSLLTVLMITAGCGGDIAVKQSLDEALIKSAGTQSYSIGTISVTADDVPSKFANLVREKLRLELTERNMLAGDKALGKANIVQMTITKYRMRGEVARQMAPLLSGTDSVNATAVVKGAGGDRILGEADVSYSNVSAPCQEDCMAYHLAKRVVEFLTSTK